jgi:hypothetical protein
MANLDGVLTPHVYWNAEGHDPSLCRFFYPLEPASLLEPVALRGAIALNADRARRRFDILDGRNYGRPLLFARGSVVWYVVPCKSG